MVSKDERKTKPISSAMVGRDEYVHGQLANPSEVFNQEKKTHLEVVVPAGRGSPQVESGPSPPRLAR